MSLFKILRGDSARISEDTTPFHDGYAYFTPDDGGLYIDVENGEEQKRIRVVGELRPCYATCSTAATTQAKEATVVSGGPFSLKRGAIVYVKFANAQTYNGQPTLNVDGTGAQNICRVGATAGMRYQWSTGEVLGFIYDGTNFLELNGGMATTTYYGITKLSSSINSTSTSLAATPSAVKQAYDLAASKADKNEPVAVTLTADGWANGSQTVTVAGVSADETKQMIQVAPSIASAGAWWGAGVTCSGQNANALEFTAIATPTVNLTVYVVVTELGTAQYAEST